MTTPREPSQVPSEDIPARGRRDIDVVVYGATGFVGKLVARHLAERAPDSVTVALAGRSPERLEAVRASLPQRAAEWRIVQADANDPESLRRMAQSAKVIASTVGPYARYGLPLVQACAEAGTDYVDLTGEVLFVRDSIDACHDRARATGARIVHSCGFDSIPSDLGVYELHRKVAADGAGELTDTTLVVTSMRGGISGGTIDSLRMQLDAVKADKKLRGTALDPYSLSPDRAAEPDFGRQIDVRLVDGKKIDPSLSGWKAPFAMAPYNTRVVRRSNALQQWAYGRRFRYSEVMNVGSSPLSIAAAGAVAGGLGALIAGLSTPPTRKLLDRVLPSPGEGPSEKSRNSGHFVVDVYGQTADGARYTSRVSAQGDPGYAATSVMLGQSALCLALDNDVPPAAGVLTPATAMGEALAGRLRDEGFTLTARRL